MDEDKARKLAEEHWEWIESVILQQLQVTRKLFIDSFVHGYKHGSSLEAENVILKIQGGERVV